MENLAITFALSLSKLLAARMACPEFTEGNPSPAADFAPFRCYIEQNHPEERSDVGLPIAQERDWLQKTALLRFAHQDLRHIRS